MARGHPPRLPLRRYACSGQKAVCGGTFRPPRPGFRPGARLRRRPRPASPRGSAGRPPARFPARLPGSAYRGGPPPAAPPPPLAPRRLAAGSAAAPPGSVPGASPWSLRLPLLAPCGPLAALRLAAGSRRSRGRSPAAGPPGAAGPAPCPPSSLGRLVAWARSGLRRSPPGPRARLRRAFLGPRPGRCWGVGVPLLRQRARQPMAR